METIAKKHGVSVAAVALAWLRDRPGVTSVILGVRKLDQLEENLKALDLTLSAQESDELEALTRPAQRYPQWMMALQGGAGANPPHS